MRSGKLLLGLLAGGWIASSVGAQTPKLLVKEHDTIIGMGSLELISSVQIINSGVWIAFIDTDFPVTDRDGAILRNGFVTLREGTTVFSPPNTTLDDFDSINMGNNGHLAMCVRAAVNGTAREALYWNTVKVGLRGDSLVSPLVGSGTTWETFDIVKMNGANEIFVVGDVLNPANGAGRDATLAKFTLDDVGNILSTEVLLTKGQILPALGTSVNDLNTTEHSLSVNEHGDWLTLVQGLGSVNAYMINGETIVAQEGQPSPLAGRTWNTLVNTPKMYLNDNGDYIHAGSLSGAGGNYLIAKNGQKFAQSGDIYPTFSPGIMQNGSAAPLFVTNDGSVFWRCDSSLGDDAYLRNFTPIIQQNVTIFNGDLVIATEQTDNAFSVSSNGRFFAGRVDLQLGGEAALFVDFGLVLPIPGCSGNDGQLKLVDGMALPGKSLVLSMDLGQVVGALPIILFSSRERVPGSDCGVNTPFGELLISTANRVGRVTLPVWNGTQPSSRDIPIPADLSLVDQTFFAQGLFRDVGGSSAPDFALTNGLRIEIGAP